MNFIANKLPGLVKEELEAANKEHPLFASAHEGYAVILEEFDEVSDECLRASDLVGQMWHWVRLDMTGALVNIASELKQTAVSIAAEAIQLAAMAQKMIDSMEGKHD